MRSPRRHPLRLLLVPALCGLALATLAIVGDRQGVPRALTLIANLAAPWTLTAFLVGRRAWSPRSGAVAGGFALVLGMAAFYAFTPDNYLHSARDIVWTAVAIVVGPVMGTCGAVSAREGGGGSRIACILPAGALLAEALWVSTEREVWRWNLALEPHRWSDVAVLASMTLAALGIPLLVGPRSGLVKTYVLIAGLGVAGAVAMSGLFAILVRV